MIFSWSPVVTVDIVGSLLTFWLAILCAKHSFLWHRDKPTDIFRHYVFLLTLSFVLFAISRSFGHLIKQLLQIYGFNSLWTTIRPVSGAINTITFVVVASFSLYFNRLQKVYNEVESFKSGLEKQVSERTRQLEEAKVTVETVLNSANPICMMDLDFAVIQANNAYYDIWPHTAPKGEVLRCFDSRPGESCGTESCPVNLIRRGMDEVVNQVKKELGDGKIGEFMVTARPFLDVHGKIIGVVESFQDVTDYTVATRELLAEREQLKVTLRSIGDGVITLDNDGLIVLINKVADQITGWSHLEAVGRPFNEVYTLLGNKTPGFSAKELMMEICAQTADSNSSPKILRRKDGVERLVSESGALIRDGENNVVGAILVFRDVTEKSRTEMEMHKLGKLESVGVLAGGIAHDFNNILMAIMGNISLALTRIDPEDDIYGWLSSAEKASARAKNLTQQLLTFAKGGEPVKNIATIQEIITESASFVLHGRNVECKYEFADNLWGVEVDTGQISQVVQNLILNGSDAMPGGGEITVNCTNFVNGKDTAYMKVGNYVKVKVTDRGSGIPVDFLDKIFDPFFTSKNEGSGLGLAVTHSIIINHGGYIEVESKVNEGTTFTFYLPASEAMPDSEQNDEPAGVSVKGKGRIMVMDDDEMIRELVYNMLHDSGYEPVLARDGEEAIKLFMEAKEKNEPILAIIMDLTIPGGMGGEEAVREIHKIDQGVKIIVSSGYSNDPIMANYRDYGFCAAMVKPFNLKEFLSVVSSALT